MAYPIDKKLVIAVASSALFDLSESDGVYRTDGEDAYRLHQRERENDVLPRGVAFPLIRRILTLNEGLSEDAAPVEVVLLSRNDPDTGLRVFNSIEQHHLPISRAAFVSGGNPFRYINSFNACLFLSANAEDVRQAVDRGLPAGRVFPTSYADREDDLELRIAFDFDGVVTDDSAESVFKSDGLAAFLQSERDHAPEPHVAGPLAKFFREIARLQKADRERARTEAGYRRRLRTAIVTARNAPAHKRVVTTLRKWGIEVDEVFFLGGVEKKRIIEVFQPHIFFDDQLHHIEGVAGTTPCAHVPFGIANEPSPELITEAFEEHVRRSDTTSSSGTDLQSQDAPSQRD